VPACAFQGKVHEVMVVPGGFLWQEEIYSSLSTIALRITGTSWSGRRFFGLRDGADPGPTSGAAREPALRKKPPARSRLVKSGPSAVPSRTAIDSPTAAAPSHVPSPSVSISQSPKSIEHPEGRA
jgi:hypothetical protein